MGKIIDRVLADVGDEELLDKLLSLPKSDFRNTDYLYKRR